MFIADRLKTTTRSTTTATTALADRYPESSCDHPTMLNEYRESTAHVSDDDLLDVCDDTDDVFADSNPNLSTSSGNNKQTPTTAIRQRVDSAGSSNNRKVS